MDSEDEKKLVALQLVCEKQIEVQREILRLLRRQVAVRSGLEGYL